MLAVVSTIPTKQHGPLTLVTCPREEEAQGIGDKFALRYPDWVKGCACKKGALAVMNRWDPNTVEERRVNRVAKTLAKKLTWLTVGQITEAIQGVIDDEAR